MYQFVFGFINITDLSIDVELQVCTTLLVSQLSPFVSDLIGSPSGEPMFSLCRKWRKFAGHYKVT